MSHAASRFTNSFSLEKWNGNEWVPPQRAVERVGKGSKVLQDQRTRGPEEQAGMQARDKLVAFTSAKNKAQQAGAILLHFRVSLTHILASYGGGWMQTYR